VILNVVKDLGPACDPSRTTRFFACGLSAATRRTCHSEARGISSPHRIWSPRTRSSRLRLRMTPASGQGTQNDTFTVSVF